MKIMTIVGARPQFIKAAVISRAIIEFNKNTSGQTIKELIVHTGQHYDYNMSKAFFDELDIPEPHYNLHIGGGSHGEQTGKMIEKIESVLLDNKPDWLLVYGDTNSTLAGALAASKLHIPIAHIEAGLRSFNKKMPEEINRILTDHVSTKLFCPTQTAVSNLHAENITKGIELVGDVMYDCALYYSDKVKPEMNRIISNFRLKEKSYYLATLHRPVNTDNMDRLQSILHAFDEIASPEYPVFLPLHPRTKLKIKKFALSNSPYVFIAEPVSYLQMVALEKNAKIILTDSGGMQKEAYFHRVPCLTLREETEWIETVENGWNTLVGSDTVAILSAVNKLESADRALPYNDSLYGTGESAVRILEKIIE